MSRVPGFGEDQRRRLLEAGIVVAALLLRAMWNDVPHYSSADEAIYAEQTRALVAHGWLSYPALVTRYLGEPHLWLFPPPSRWGYLALTTLTAHLNGASDPHALAWLSTVAGALSVLLAMRLGARLFSREVGLWAGALMLTSPLELALGRRALSDEPFCAALLASLLALLPIVNADEKATRRQYALAAAALTVTFSIKETTLLAMPALLVLLVAAVRRRGWCRMDLVLLLLPPLAHVAGFMLWSHSFGDFFRVATAEASTTFAEYPTRYQSGPPQRILFDLFVLAPLVLLLATAALALIGRNWKMPEHSGARVLALWTVSLAGVLSLIVSKNVRYAVGLDPALRILAAFAILELTRARRALTAATIAVIGVSELLTFHTIFIRAAVYDPVTDNLLRALRAIP
jgi:4-amino-4-deoxy-L-arabinose transferase-like glycosyltransferase